MKKITYLSLVLVSLSQGGSGQEPRAVPSPAPDNPARPGNFSPAFPNPPFGAPGGGGAMYYQPGLVAPVAVGSVALSSGGVPPLVVRFSGGTDSANGPMEEDLNVMSRLLERSLEREVGEDSPEVKSRIRLLYTEGGRSVRALYLEGFGALFMIKVGFPVFAPPALSETKEPQPASDSEWDSVKKELYGASDGRPADGLGGVVDSKYDAEQVAALKKALLQSLSSAANIRNLNPSDFVAITVFGHPGAVTALRKTSRAKTSSQATPAAEGKAETTVQQRKSAADREKEKADKALNLAASGRTEQRLVGVVRRESDILRSAAQGTVMSLRVRKADLDALANGKLDFERFEKKVEQHSYAGSGYGITSLNSWSKSGTGITSVLR